MRDRHWPEWVRHNATNILRLAIVALFLGLAVWAITLNHYELVIANREPWLWLTVALVSVGPELAGIVIGIVTIDYLNEWRQDEQLKGQLVLQLGSTHNDVTDTALRALKARGWLYDGSLSRASLEKANLSGARLREANLKDARVREANLSEADLSYANLSGANLEAADLSGADLWMTNLSGANLSVCHLSGARLQKSNLSEAFLIGTNLSGVNLEGANLSGVNANWGMDNETGDEYVTNLSRASLENANLSGARLREASLSEANLEKSDLSGAFLEGANLSGVIHWTIEQLEQAQTLEGATMPDKVQLGVRKRGGDGTGGEQVEGLTFEDWKAQYLAKYGGAAIDTRDWEDKPDDAADGQVESSSPGPI